MSGKNSKNRANTSKNESKKRTKRNENGLGMSLSKDLRKKIEAEKNPEAVFEKALSEYYAEKPQRPEQRYENAVQKEIDNNVIEIQRRHISDLKDQLTASNKNYEELMKTYQAYMLQVQPLVEAARLQKAAESALISEKTETENGSKKAEENESAEKQTATQTQQQVQTERQAQTQQQTQTERQAQQTQSQETQNKKWYMFWK